MLPKETSVRQLKKLRAETNGTDIGDLTSKDRLNHNIPNLQYIGNPVDKGIESWEEFSKKDSQIQTIAFKSKLVNKPIVKTNEIIGFYDPDSPRHKLDIDNLDEPCKKCENGIYKRKSLLSLKLQCDKCGHKVERFPEKYGYSDEEIIHKNNKNSMKDIKTFEDFENSELDILNSNLDPNRRGKMEEDEEQEYFERPFEEEIDTDRQDVIDLLCANSDFEEEELEHLSDEELDQLLQDFNLDLNDDNKNDFLDDFHKNEFDSLFTKKDNDDEIENDLEESIKTFEDFAWAEGEERDDLIRKGSDSKLMNYFKNTWANNTDVTDVILKNNLSQYFKYIDPDFDWTSMNNEELRQLWDDWSNDENRLSQELEEGIKTFEAFSVPAAKKEEKQPEYTMLGKEKELKSDPNFGYAAVRAQEIKKISDFNLIDPSTPKERTIGGNAGVFIDNDKVKGYVNRIEGKDVYVESIDEPMKIKKFNIKDVVKTKKSE